jgi:hypothetical protein
LFCLFFIRLSWSYDLRIVFNGLTRFDSGCFLCLLFNWFFFHVYHSTLSRLKIEFHNLFYFAFYENILISQSRSQVLVFLLWLNEVVFFIFFLRGYIDLMTRVTSLSTLDLFFIRLSMSYDMDRGFDGLTQLTYFFSFFLIDFFFNFIN